MENLDTKSQEVGPFNGLPRLSGVDAEPKWNESPPQAELSTAAFPVNPMLARLEDSKLVRKLISKSRSHDGGETNHSSEEPEEIGRVLLEFLDDEAKLAPEAQSRNSGRQLSPPEKFQEYVLELAAWLERNNTDKNNSNKSEAATEQSEVEESDENLSSEDESEIEVGLSRAASLSGDVDSQPARQQDMLESMSMDERSNILIKSTQHAASSSNSVANEVENLPQPTRLTQLADPQLQPLQSPNGSQQYYGSQRYHGHQQLSFLQHPLQSAHVNHPPGMPSQMTMALDAATQWTCVPRQSPSAVSDLVICYEDPSIQTTRQEQRWRSQPQGPYYRGTQDPKKVVRNCFLNEWLSMHRPDIPLPNSSGQGFKQQNRVFENLSRQDQQAVNDYVVRRVEAEQAEKRRIGTAEYRVVDAKTGKVSADGAPKDISGSVMQSSTNGMLLGRRIAPTPTGYNQPGHGSAQVNASRGHSMNPSVGQSNSYHPSSQVPMQHGLANNYHAVRGFPGNQYGGAMASQTWSTMASVYGGEGMTWADSKMVYSQHNYPISQNGSRMGVMQGGPPMFWYPHSLPGPRPDYPHSVYANQYAAGPPLMMPPNLGMQSPLDSASSSSMHSSPSTSASSFANNGSICSNIQYAGENDDEDADKEGQASGHRAAKTAR